MTLSGISPLATPGVQGANPNVPAPAASDPGTDALAAQLEAPSDTLSISALGQAIADAPDAALSGPASLLSTYSSSGSVSPS